MVCAPVQSIIHSLKLVDYQPVQADKPWSVSYLPFKLYHIEKSTYLFKQVKAGLHSRRGSLNELTHPIYVKGQIIKQKQTAI